MFIYLGLALVVAQAAIFGKDDRVAIRPHSQSYELSRSTAVAILTSLYEPVPGSLPATLKIYTDNMSDYMCKSERFYDDPSLPYACTGFLVAPDIIATAGHCMTNFGEVRNEPELYCDSYSWLFDFNQPKSGPLALNEVPAEDLYTCKQILYAISEEKPPYRDFALVQLDRVVKDRAPLKLASGRKLKRTERFAMIGYPLGTPAKLSHSAKTLFNDETRESFVTNLDAFGGNSGSPVLNSRSEVVGILIAGTPDSAFVRDPEKRCDTLNRCSENGRTCSVMDGSDANDFSGYPHPGSEVQRIDPLAKMLKATSALAWSARPTDGSSDDGGDTRSDPSQRRTPRTGNHSDYAW